MLTLHLGLQGGGAHGAFTWGVLDRLLDEPDIRLDRVSGTSAGALNGAVLASGLAHGGRAGAQRRLTQLWRQIAVLGSPFTMLMLPLRKPSLGIWDDAMPLISPYMANPVGLAPLREILSGLVDEAALRGDAAPRLFVNAVNVQTGHNRVFGPGEISLDALLASACAPLVFPAVQIEDGTYWDGSYAANPSLRPLFQDQRDIDLLLVELTPLVREETPVSAKNILNRINEIASINALKAELRELEALNTGEDRRVRMHVISLPEEGTPVTIEPSIKRSVDLGLFESLHLMGRAACERWLHSHGADVGVKGSVHLLDGCLKAR